MKRTAISEEGTGLLSFALPAAEAQEIRFANRSTDNSRLCSVTQTMAWTSSCSVSDRTAMCISCDVELATHLLQI